MINRLEQTVREVYGELRAAHPEICGCERCEADVVAFALNNVRPRYGGGNVTGQALISVDLQRDQTRATVAVLVLDAMRRVAATPRHGPVGTGSGEMVGGSDGETEGGSEEGSEEAPR